MATSGEIGGAPICGRVILGGIVIFAALFLLPALLGWGVKIQLETWNRAGLAAAVIYVASTVYAHHAALSRIQKFAELNRLQVESIGPLPLPPSLCPCTPLLRTSRPF